MKDSRYAIVAWAVWLQKHHDSCTYSEGPQRYANLNHRGVLPFVGDCSATVRDYYNWAGASDPYRLGYADPEGFTGTELAAGNHIPLLLRNGSGRLYDDVEPGDAVVYGPGTGWHTALVVFTRGKDILTVSMGRQGDPSFVWVNAPSGPSFGFGADGRQPQTYLRFPTHTRKTYWPRGYTPRPSPFQARRSGLRGVDGAQATRAERNGWTVYGWDGTWFRPQDASILLGHSRWASPHFTVQRLAS